MRTFTHNQGLNWIGIIQNNLLFKKKKMIGSLFSNPFHFILYVYAPVQVLFVPLCTLWLNCGLVSGKALKFVTLNTIYPISQWRIIAQAT